MSAATKLSGFAAILLVVVAAAFGVGKAVGPVSASANPATGTMAHSGGDSGSPDSTEAPTAPAVGGLTSSDQGYSLLLAAPTAPSGNPTALRFHIAGPNGRPVTEFDQTHDKQLHLIAVRTDTSGFQHVHPTMDPAGIWTTELDLTPGAWRLFTDFQPTGFGTSLTLGVNLSVPGDYRPSPLPAPNLTAIVDGYTVTLNGDLVAGRMSDLTLNISRGGMPVIDLQPYLGAFGHLVALRANDLAYLHVHPQGEPGDGVTPAGPDITFGATAPSAGTYRLYLDFQHNGVVRTAEFTVTVADGPPAPKNAENAENTAVPNDSGPAATTTADHGGGH